MWLFGPEDPGMAHAGRRDAHPCTVGTGSTMSIWQCLLWDIAKEQCSRPNSHCLPARYCWFGLKLVLFSSWPGLVCPHSVPKGPGLCSGCRQGRMGTRGSCPVSDHVPSVGKDRRRRQRVHTPCALGLTPQARTAPLTWDMKQELLL